MQLLGGSTDPKVPTWVLLVLITLAAMAGCALLGVVIERFAYRPLRNAPRIAPLISALGVSFFLAYSMQLMFGSEQRDYDAFALSGGALFFNGFDIGGVRVPLLRIVIVVSAFALMIVLWLLVTRTRTGKAMRATSYDREAAAMMGIDVDRVIVFAFVLGSALAGAAGVMFALRAPTDVAIGFLAGLKGFTAAVIGGIGSIPGAMAGGLILGFAEAFTQGYISTRWSDLLVFVLLIASCCSGPRGSSASPTSRRSEWPTTPTASTRRPSRARRALRGRGSGRTSGWPARASAVAAAAGGWECSKRVCASCPGGRGSSSSSRSWRRCRSCSRAATSAASPSTP